MTHARAVEAASLAGATDPLWSPPLAPEDDPATAAYVPPAPADWPDWVTSPDGYAPGSAWRLARDAHVVLPRHLGVPTLATGPDPTPGGRYAVAEGTRLTLVRAYDAEAAAGAADLADPVTYWQYIEGWSTRTYRIEGGPSAGLLVWLPADARGLRFPLSARIAHAAIVPDPQGAGSRP